MTKQQKKALPPVIKPEEWQILPLLAAVHLRRGEAEREFDQF